MNLASLARYASAILIFIFCRGGIADTLNELRPTESMGEFEAENFCRDWDDSLALGLATGPGAMLGQLIAQDVVSNGRVMRLRYDNGPIVDRIVTLFIAECQFEWAENIRAGETELAGQGITQQRRSLLVANLERDRARLRRSQDRDGDLLAGVPREDPERYKGENGLDYRDQLGALAVSTQSPRVYDYLWYYSTFVSGPAVTAYFARVNPEETLLHLFNASVGTPSSPVLHSVFDSVYRADGQGEMNVVCALEYVGGIVTFDPELGIKFHDEIVGFIGRCRGVYLDPLDATLSQQHRVHDYRMRRAMLKVLAVIGTVNDVPLTKKLISEIAHDDKAAALDEKRVKSGELPISALANEVVGVIEARNP